MDGRVIRFTPFANRLAYDGIPKRIQKLRCYTNFVALRFAQPIANMGNILVKRMKAKSAKTNGNYVSIHLRFEEVPHFYCPVLILIECQLKVTFFTTLSLISFSLKINYWWWGNFMNSFAPGYGSFLPMRLYWWRGRKNSA